MFVLRPVTVSKAGAVIVWAFSWAKICFCPQPKHKKGFVQGQRYKHHLEQIQLSICSIHVHHTPPPSMSNVCYSTPTALPAVPYQELGVILQKQGPPEQLINSCQPLLRPAGLSQSKSCANDSGFNIQIVLDKALC